MPKPTCHKDDHEFLARFTVWHPWQKRENELRDLLNSPGIYALAISEQPLNEPFSFREMEAIAYFGMTNAMGGLRARLKQFDKTFSKKVKKLTAEPSAFAENTRTAKSRV